MDPTNISGHFDQLDALEQNIENAPIPGGIAFQDPLCQMLGKLEQSIEASVVKPPLVPEEPGVLENPSQGYLPLQEESQEARPEQETIHSPPLPYYIETPQRPAPFHTPPHRQGGRIGRRGGRDFKSSPAGQGDKIYCPIEKDYVSRDFCEDQDCEYYDEDGDPDSGWHCTYHDDEEP